MKLWSCDLGHGLKKRRKEKENEIFHRKRNGDQKEKKTHTQCDNRIALERW